MPCRSPSSPVETSAREGPRQNTLSTTTTTFRLYGNVVTVSTPDMPREKSGEASEGRMTDKEDSRGSGGTETMLDQPKVRQE